MKVKFKQLNDIHIIKIAGLFLILELFVAGIILFRHGNIDVFASVSLLYLLISTVTVFVVKKYASNIKVAVSSLLLLLIGITLQSFVQEKEYGRKILYILAFSFAASAVFWVLYFKIHDLWRKVILLPILAALTILGYAGLFVYGNNVNGTNAWIIIGGFSFQVTILFKIIYIYYLSLVFAVYSWSDMKKILSTMPILSINFCGLIAIREMGTLLVMCILYLLYCILFLRQIKTIFVMIIAGGIVLLFGFGLCFLLSHLGINNVVVQMADKISNRLYIWIHPEADPFNLGYQGLKAKEAMALGGVFGSNYKIEIPVAESDYVFPALILYMGVFVAAIVVILYILLLVEGIKTYLYADQELEKGLVVGFTYSIFIESVLMMFGSTGFFVMTGVPMAFISDGGTAMLTNFLMITFMLCVDSKLIQNKKRKERFYNAEDVIRKN